MLLYLLTELKITFLDAGLLKSLERLKNSPELKREAQELFQLLTQGTGKMRSILEQFQSSRIGGG